MTLGSTTPPVPASTHAWSGQCLVASPFASATLRRTRTCSFARSAGANDTYAATRHAALQPTAHAIRFDHNSAFHFFDSGRYLQAQLLLHVLRLLEW